MQEPKAREQPLVGRDAELDSLKVLLEKAKLDNGSTVLISGEPGIGKTRLVEEFRNHAEAEGARILSSAALSGSAHPFQIFSKALEGITAEPIFEEREHTSFTEIFAVNSAGLLLAKASSEKGGLDADIFAGMLSAVQDFIRDSLGQGGKKAGLGRLEYGNMKILIEHGQHSYLIAVVTGSEHPDMINSLRQALNKIEDNHGSLLKNWGGKMAEMAPVQHEITNLASIRFLVRKDLAGMKLETERLRIADRVLVHIVKYAAEKPLILLLEDLHWADESALFVLHYLARNIQNISVMIIGTFRPKESASMDATLDIMIGEEIANELTLMKLDSGNISEIINSVCPDNNFPRNFIDMLAERCGGTPLFVIELLKHMSTEGTIKEIDGKYVIVSESYSIPDTVEGVIQSRLSRLTPESLAIAEYASCIGREFQIAVAQSNGTIADPNSALDNLQNSEIIIRQNGSAEFCHALYQEVIYSTISQRWKSAYHKSIGEYFEQTYIERTDDIVFELARHFNKTSEHEKNFKYSFMAGEKSEGVYALSQAIEYYNNALAALPGVQPNEQISMNRLMILERLGDAYSLTSRYEESKAVLEELYSHSSDSETRARALRKIALNHEAIGEYEKSLEVISTAKAELGDIIGRETAMITMAEGVIYWHMGENDKALPRFQDSLSKLEELGDEREVANTLRLIGNVHMSKSDYDQALHYYHMGMAISEKSRDQYALSSCLNNMGAVNSILGQLDIAQEFLERGLKIQERMGDKQGVGISYNNIGTICYHRGNLCKAEENYLRALDIGRRTGDKSNIANALGNLGNVYQNRGDLERALDCQEQSIRAHEASGDPWGTLTAIGNAGGVCLDLEDWSRAMEYYGKGLPIGEEIGDRHGIIHFYTGMAEAYIGMGKNEDALAQSEKALALSMELEAIIEEGISRRLLGSVHMELGDFTEAENQFTISLKSHETGGRMDEVPRIYFEQALLCKAKGDKSGAQKKFEEALALFESMGMNLWAKRCRRALGEIDS